MAQNTLLSFAFESDLKAKYNRYIRGGIQMLNLSDIHADRCGRIDHPFGHRFFADAFLPYRFENRTVPAWFLTAPFWTAWFLAARELAAWFQVQGGLRL